MSYNLNYVYPKQLEDTERLARHDYFVDKALRVEEFSSALVLPGTFNGGGGVVNAENDYLEHTYLHRGIGFKYHCSSVKSDHRKVVYVGMFHDCWGHCFTDNIKHLWFLLNSEYDFLRNYAFVYTTVFPDYRELDNFTKLLECLDIDVRRLERITEATRFDSVFVPDDCIFLNVDNNYRCFTSEYKLLIDSILPPPHHHHTQPRRQLSSIHTTTNTLQTNVVHATCVHIQSYS